MALPEEGCPAHAGIDLLTLIPYLACGWLPRPCGDRPKDWYAVNTLKEVAPPTRG